MRYYITINGFKDVETTTRDLAVFIGKKLKEEHPKDEIKIFNSKGEFVFEFVM